MKRIAEMCQRSSCGSAGTARRRRRTGSTLLVVLITLVVVLGLGIVLAEVTSRELTNSVYSLDREQALAAAESGIEQCIWQLKNNSLNGKTLADGSWRTNKAWSGHPAGTPYTGTMPGSGATFSVTVLDIGSGYWTGDVAIASTGTSKDKQDSVTVTEVEQIYAENLSAWANAIFAGSGQSGNAIAGNVIVHGSVHILGDGEPYTDVNGNGQWDSSIQEPYQDQNGNGKYDTGEPFTDLNGNGKWDSSVNEPWTDTNGNGVYDGPLSATQFAASLNGTAAVYNNYESQNGWPSDWGTGASAKLPSLDQVNVNGTQLYTLHGKVRVKHGEVSLQGNTQIGQTTAMLSSTADKGTMDGSYVSNGYAAGDAVNVHSDNGTSHVYDLPDGLITFPSLIPAATVNGTNYTSWLAYIQANSYHYTTGWEDGQSTGDLTLDSNTAGSASSPKWMGDGASYSTSTNALQLWKDGSGYLHLSIKGIIVAQTGNVNIGDQKGVLYYTGDGTIVSGGTVGIAVGTTFTTILNSKNVYVHGNLIADGTYSTGGGFPNNVLGLIATNDMDIETGSGDSQADIMGAFFAEGQTVFNKQTAVAGACVCSEFQMNQVPEIFQVPALANHLPPGMPGGTPVIIVDESLVNYYMSGN